MSPGECTPSSDHNGCWTVRSQMHVTDKADQTLSLMESLIRQQRESALVRVGRNTFADLMYVQCFVTGMTVEGQNCTVCEL